MDFRKNTVETTDIGGHRVARFVGKCITCGARCFAWDNDINDPRGPLGLHAVNYLEPTEYGYGAQNDRLPMCGGCSQEGDRYNRALAIAREAWKPKRVKVHGRLWKPPSVDWHHHTVTIEIDDSAPFKVAGIGGGDNYLQTAHGHLVAIGILPREPYRGLWYELKKHGIELIDSYEYIPRKKDL